MPARYEPGPGTSPPDLDGVSTRRVNLGAAIGAVGALDAITVQGTPGDDIVGVSGGSGTVRVDGLVTILDIADSEPTDTLRLPGNGGVDSVASAGLAPDTIVLTLV